MAESPSSLNGRGKAAIKSKEVTHRGEWKEGELDSDQCQLETIVRRISKREAKDTKGNKIMVAQAKKS